MTSFSTSKFSLFACTTPTPPLLPTPPSVFPRSEPVIANDRMRNYDLTLLPDGSSSLDSCAGSDPSVSSSPSGATPAASRGTSTTGSASPCTPLRSPAGGSSQDDTSPGEPSGRSLDFGPASPASPDAADEPAQNSTPMASPELQAVPTPVAGAQLHIACRRGFATTSSRSWCRRTALCATILGGALFMLNHGPIDTRLPTTSGAPPWKPNTLLSSTTTHGHWFRGRLARISLGANGCSKSSINLMDRLTSSRLALSLVGLLNSMASIIQILSLLL